VTLLEVRRRLKGTACAREPEAPGDRRAAVALLLRERSDLEILFIERAVREDDPWSGQVAFPGGRVDPEDADPLAAAIRESVEEVGISPSPESFIAPLDELRARRKTGVVPLIVSSYVFSVPPETEARISDEVSEAVWIRAADLLDPRAPTSIEICLASGSAVFPAIRYGRFTIWGLTYRMLDIFFERAGMPFPKRG
jgi:8-oxo-dGTP pyrophosphatase MutT (NUDIX family)